MPPLLSLRDVSLSVGPQTLFDGLELHIANRDRLCLLGRNGTGKSTLLRVIAGSQEPDSGDRFIQPGVAIASVEQDPDTGGAKTLGDFAGQGLTAGQEMAHHLIDPLFADLGLDREAPCAGASGGELRRAALVRALVADPDILLLDEPTNHLDINAIRWLEDTLKGFRGAMVLISHDRAFLTTLSSASLWLDRGQVRRYEGRFDGFEAWQDATLAAEADQLKKLDKKIKEETRWSVEGISGRRKRNMGRLRALHALRAERQSATRQSGAVSFDLRSGRVSGKQVLEAKQISKEFAGRTLFSGLDLKMIRGDRLGLIGPNGAGKSTLINVLTGVLPPDSGSVKMGTNLDPLILDQKRSSLDPTATVADILGDGGDWVVSADGKKTHVMSYMKDFLFSPTVARAPVGSLSGGEKGRLLLARGFANPTNFMVLDEPTNDLDMDTLDLLVEVLADYDGTLILVSHDRDFLDRIVTSSLVLEGDGTALEYPGGYSDYYRQRQAISAAKSAAKASPAQKNKTNVVALKTKKLSYKDQRALDMLPAEIESLNMQIKEAEARLSDPDFYREDPQGFKALSTDLTAMKDSVDEKEMRWLELEELKDSL